jgi:di- and tripeptidase
MARTHARYVRAFHLHHHLTGQYKCIDTCDIPVSRVQVLAELTNRDRQVLIPGFCTCCFPPYLPDRADHPHLADDQVRPQDDEEAALFRLLESATQQPAASLSARWREPSLTIHSVRGSGPTSTSRPRFCFFSQCAQLNGSKDPTVIPASVTAQVSLRIVPDQSLDAVCSSLVQHLRASFDALNSANSIKVTLRFFILDPLRADVDVSVL